MKRFDDPEISEAEVAWLAGVLEGEGCFFMVRNPCNGIGGRHKDCGTWSSCKRAEAFVKEHAHDWDWNAYKIEEIETK